VVEATADASTGTSSEHSWEVALTSCFFSSRLVSTLSSCFDTLGDLLDAMQQEDVIKLFVNALRP
jgi:hypothetical protein